MTDYEIIMIVIGILGLPISVCTLLLVLLTFLEKISKKMPILCADRIGGVRKDIKPY